MSEDIENEVQESIEKTVQESMSVYHPYLHTLDYIEHKKTKKPLNDNKKTVRIPALTKSETTKVFDKSEKKPTTRLFYSGCEYPQTEMELGFIKDCKRNALNVTEAKLYVDDGYLILRRTAHIQGRKAISYEAVMDLDDFFETGEKTKEAIKNLMIVCWGTEPIKVTRALEKITAGLMNSKDFFSFEPLFSYCESVNLKEPFIQCDKFHLVTSQAFKDLTEIPYRNKTDYFLRFFKEQVDLKKLFE